MQNGNNALFCRTIFSFYSSSFSPIALLSHSPKIRSFFSETYICICVYYTDRKICSLNLVLVWILHHPELEEEKNLIICSWFCCWNLQVKIMDSGHGTKIDIIYHLVEAWNASRVHYRIYMYVYMRTAIDSRMLHGSMLLSIDWPGSDARWRSRWVLQFVFFVLHVV